MKNLLLFTLLLCIVCPAFSKEAPLLFVGESQGFSQLINKGKDVYCITSNTLYSVEKNRLHTLASFNFICNEAAFYNNNILLATSIGIQEFNTTSGTISNYLPQGVNGNISHIQTDELNQIWFTKEFEGCFKINNNEIKQIISVPVTYALAHTGDSIVWVGTNVGMYKVPVSGKEIERYAEEGIGNNDLPDNLVERLFAGITGGVWAVMPGHVSFISSNQEEEGPDFENLGSQSNELYCIEEIPSFNQSFLFVTSQGILYIPRFQNTDLLRAGEIHQTIKETAYQLKDVLIQKPEAFTNEAVQKVQFIGSKIYFITNKGLWAMPIFKFTQQLKKSY